MHIPSSSSMATVTTTIAGGIQSTLNQSHTNGGGASGSSIYVTKSNVVPPMPIIKTVSNGSALYSVMYAGSGNKITIKRKTDSQSSSTSSQQQQQNHLQSSSGSNNSDLGDQSTSGGDMKGTMNSSASSMHQTLFSNNNSNNNHNTSYSNQDAGSSSGTGGGGDSSGLGFKKPPLVVRSKALAKRKGCRCGNATLTPGKLTCCGQRCPCYVESKACIDCKCRGCRNPHRADGLKVRPHIPELENLDYHLNAVEQQQLQQQQEQQAKLDGPIMKAVLNTLNGGAVGGGGIIGGMEVDGPETGFMFSGGGGGQASSSSTSGSGNSNRLGGAGGGAVEMDGRMKIHGQGSTLDTITALDNLSNYQSTSSGAGNGPPGKLQGE